MKLERTFTAIVGPNSLPEVVETRGPAVIGNGKASATTLDTSLLHVTRPFGPSILPLGRDPINDQKLLIWQIRSSLMSICPS